MQTDLELIDEFISESRQHIPPALFRDIQDRGLYHIVNRLPQNVDEAKAIARARLRNQGKYIGDPEIEQIAQEVNRIEFLRKELMEIKPTDVDRMIPILSEMSERAIFVRDYFKPQLCDTL